MKEKKNAKAIEITIFRVLNTKFTSAHKRISNNKQGAILRVFCLKLTFVHEHIST
jgi:hypothetical protein